MSDPQPTLSYESTPPAWTGIGIGTIALQLVGVYCFVLALPVLTLIASVAGVSSGLPTGWRLLFSLVTPAVYIVMGVLLIRFAPQLSVWLFGRSVAGGVMSGPVTASAGQHLQAIAFSVVGVLLVVEAAPGLVSLVWMAMTDMSPRFGGEGYAAMVQPVVQILLGVALFLQSKGLALLWHKIRTGGIAPAAASVSSPIPSDPNRA